MLRGMERWERARVHGALADEHRLAIVDELLLGDRTPGELADLTGLPGNLLAHHLSVLDLADLIHRTTSEGDRRRRYVRLVPGLLDDLLPRQQIVATSLLFVCTRNSARSQFAAALWRDHTGLAAQSAGADPAPRVHPKAVLVAAERGIDLSTGTPRGYEAVVITPDLIISVCDRARERELPFSAPLRHWSIPDPVARNTRAAFRSAFADISDRVSDLARMHRGTVPR
jgi:protein-tyrosine-phosphatase